ncbi:MAG: hypothetical protein K5888_04760 [Lachnospiraceae bacterium]|nr:hypothetical protein [Lachnospiraceae bacterium]
MKKYIIALCIMLVFLSGCGKKDESIENYRTGMEEILAEISNINNEINSLNPDDENSMNSLMISLDKLDVEFKKMTELEYPEGFDQIKKLATDASSDMSASVSRFHDAYDGEYNEVAQSEAYDLYQDANQKLKVLIQVLRGEYENPSEEADTEETIETEGSVETEEYIDTEE